MSQGEDEGNFICEPMAQALMHQQYDMMAFWRLLALCHTVQPEMVLGDMEYQAQSPDEKALVEAARYAPSRPPVSLLRNQLAIHLNVLCSNTSP